MLNKDRFTNDAELMRAFEADPCMHMPWCLARWLFVEFDEDRLAYLRNMERCRIGTVAMGKEIKRLEKAAAKEVRP